MLFFNNLLKNNIDFINNFCDNVNEKYIESIQKDKYNRTIFHCIDNKWNIDNITSFITYRILYNKNEKLIIILMIGVNKNIRSNGYGKIILDEFIEYHNKKISEKRSLNICVHSVKLSENFFINYGFEKINKCIFLQNYEGWSNEQNNEKLLYKLNI